MLLFAIVFSLVACSSNDTTPSHEGNVNPPSSEENSNKTPVHTHNFGEWSVVIQPHCETEGLSQRWCSACNYTESKAIDAIGHTETISEHCEPTCTITGLTEGKYCSTCFKVFVEREIIAKLDHTFGEWETTSEPDMIYEGAEERSCECGEKETRAIPTLPPITIKEICVNPEPYIGQRIALEGIVMRRDSNGAYLQSYDSENDKYFNIYVYFGYGVKNDIYSIYSIGNRVRVVGILFANIDQRQIADIQYSWRDPDHPLNSQILDKGCYIEESYSEIDIQTLRSDVTIKINGVEKTCKYYSVYCDTPISIKNLTVVEINRGFDYLVCQDNNGLTINVYVDNPQQYTEGDIIDVKGLIVGKNELSCDTVDKHE